MDFRLKRAEMKRQKDRHARMVQSGIQEKNIAYQMKNYYVYILASKKNGTLYIGVTNDLMRRVYEHKEGLVEGFTKRYNIKTFVYYEMTSDINEAIKREKELKKWNRQWKIRLIEKTNPNWDDLSKDF